MVSKICPNCGINFIVSNQNKNQECCNRKCKTELNNKRKTKQCECCGKDFIIKNRGNANKYCSVECTIKLTEIKECVNCGTKFKDRGTKDTNKFCNKDCWKDYVNKNKLSNILTKEELLKRERERDYINNNSFSTLHHIECLECKKIFISKTKLSKYCSEKCRYQNKKEVFNKVCTICNKEFKTKSLILKQCSNECKSIYIKILRKKNYKNSRDNKKHIKRANKFNVEYDNKTTLKNILLRDGNKCLICNNKVLDKNVSGYHKRNATIGHIVPLSKGGNHTMQNVQLECQECNTKKGAKIDGQLRLF